MTFNTDKYYVCVGEYKLSEEQEQANKQNQFISTLQANHRPRYIGGASYNTYSYDYLYDYDENGGELYVTPYPSYNRLTIVPKFTVGKIYQSYFNTSLRDDNGMIITIDDENEKNFVELNFTLSDIVKNEIRKFKERRVSILTQIEPVEFINFDKDAYDRLHDLSVFTLWFKVTMTGVGTSYSGIYALVDDNSIQEAFHEIWKRIRCNSRQCNKIKAVLPHPSRYGFKSNRIYRYNDWGL